MEEQVKDLKAEVYDLNKEVIGLSGWIGGIAKLLEVPQEEATLETIREAVEALLKE